MQCFNRAAARPASPPGSRSSGLRFAFPFRFPMRLPTSTASIIKGLALMVSIIATSASAQGTAASPADGVYDLLVGTYTGPKSEGIDVYRFDTKTGQASRVSSAKTVKDRKSVV